MVEIYFKIYLKKLIIIFLNYYSLLINSLLYLKFTKLIKLKYR